MKCARKEVESWGQLLKKFNRFRYDLEKPSNVWIFRGEFRERSLKTTLERAFEDFVVPANNRMDIENEMIDDFRRRYDGRDLARV